MIVGSLRILAVFALCLQMAVPSLAVAASQAGVDVSRFICVTPGTEMSETNARMAERLAAALSTEDEAPDVPDDKCALCVLASAAVLPAMVRTVDVTFTRSQPPAMRFESGIVSAPRGPPVGATGPPSSQLI